MSRCHHEGVDAKRMLTWFGRMIAASLAVSGVMAAEFHGTVKSGGLPFPGVTVTATLGDQKAVTTILPTRRASSISPIWPMASGRSRSRCWDSRRFRGKLESRRPLPLRNGS
ncbi:exported hypothetical protein [Candidatus Sulfopaludibacter sp. SbA6]|nr:exported hypothetical protein [Candidatus Sulfopaludibacter sp. SbA6]